MQDVVLQRRWSHGSNEVERDTQLQQVVDRLEGENRRLKRLVVRLSETIIRNVVDKR